MQTVRYTQNAAAALSEIVTKHAPDQVFVLCDSHTEQLCLPLLQSAGRAITIQPSDAAKTLDTLASVWTALQQGGATRHSLLVNLGGGMVTDLGGFAAATFKRGIRFVNIPTTLLGMVDAAVGGKTGINFGGLKNEVGSFREAEEVLICTKFLATLDAPNLCSGYAEMLKHSLLSSRRMWSEHLLFDLADPDFGQLQTLVQQSIEVKQSIVAQDPHEQGIRKALNLGHTIGHALESWHNAHHAEALLHGYAVAWGLVAELYLAAAQTEMPVDVLRQTARFVFDHYGRPAIGCNDYDSLYDLMLHDKKNRGRDINFTLLHEPGQVLIDQHVERTLIDESLDFLRDA